VGDRFGEVSWVMNGTLRHRLIPTVVLLVLCVAPPCAEAQQFVCWPIVRGDTASRLARQLTGNAGAVYTNAFQIRDPARGVFVPKSHYRRLSTEWEACVAKGPVRSVPLSYAPVASATAAVVPEEPPITSAPLAITAPLALPPSDGSPEGGFSAAVITGAVLLMMLIGVAVAGSLAPRPIPPLMQRAGEEFVSAFARPLVDSSSSVPPIHARLRFVHRRGQLEISIAPGAGRRYPNLIDHKRNVEYDVTRVMRFLGPHFVVSDRLRTSGRWVVVPIRLAEQKQAGAK
jgi:hypothetical protein